MQISNMQTNVQSVFCHVGGSFTVSVEFNSLKKFSSHF